MQSLQSVIYYCYIGFSYLFKRWVKKIWRSCYVV